MEREKGSIGELSIEEIKRLREITKDRLCDVLDGKGKVLVIDPYAVAPHIDDGVLLPDGTQRKAGDARGSFYTNVSLGPISKIVNNSNIEKIIIFSDASLGSDHASAGDIVERNLREGGNGREPIDTEKVKIVHIKDQKMASTANQIEALAGLIQSGEIKSEDLVYYTSWQYHGERIQNHLDGWGIDAQVLYYEFVNEYLNSKFDLETLYKVLPLDEIEKMESLRRWLSGWEKKGRIPKYTQKLLGGAYTLDNAKSPNGLEFVYMPGKKRLAQVEEIQRLRELYPEIPSYVLDYAVRSTDDLKGKVIKGRAEKYLNKVIVNFKELKDKYSSQGIEDRMLARVSAWHVDEAVVEMEKLLIRSEILSLSFPDINPEYILHTLIFYPWEDANQHLLKVSLNRARRAQRIGENASLGVRQRAFSLTSQA